nr:hypothetical protein [uncultured Undibacterium sp.]
MDETLELDDLWSKFSEKISGVELLYRAVNSAIGNELLAIKKLSGYGQNHKFIFSNLVTKRNDIYLRKELEHDEILLALYFRKNRQFQWMLVQAFEDYEDFIFNVFASLALDDATIWTGRAICKNISLHDISQNGLSWYMGQPKNRKGQVKDKLNTLQAVFPRLKKIEDSNGLNVNLRVGISLVEKLRHLIVHNSGNTNDREFLIDEILKDAGRSITPNASRADREFIEQFLGTSPYDNMISLLEIKNSEAPSLVVYEPLKVLINLLLDHSHLIYHLIVNKGAINE